MKLHFKRFFFLLVMQCYPGLCIIFAQDISITVNATIDKKVVSPYIYGRNNTFDKPAQFYKDAGLRLARMNGGNNATKYNWRKKITSHPDWYNNVYGSDWDKTSKDIALAHPAMQVMWAFQLIGKVASGTSSNFNDWGFNHSQYWFGVGQNLAGGGIPDTITGASKALKEGDISLYTQTWPADSTVEVLNHFFGEKGLGLNKNQFTYWNMDNEPDVWNGTHDDVMKTLLPSSEFMDRFITVAKKARGLFPGIKICGPVTTSEWQWFKWGSEGITINGKYYCWLEYFIKRCADEEKASGIRVLDVVDLHNYPYAPNGDTDALQLHRMYYDQEYIYPGANGLKTINGGWETGLNKEYVFKRIDDWLTHYFGENNGIRCGISEWSPATSESNANATSVVYASHLGTFANDGVEYFTPWTWFNGMWETMHLFSRYAKGYSVSTTSSIENTVSAYSTVNETADSMTVIIVNRDMSFARNVTVNLNGYSVADRSYTSLQLSSLPSTETFVSHTNNALKLNSVTVKSNSFTMSLPALSTTAILLRSTSTGIAEPKNQADEINIYPNPVSDKLNISISSNIAEPTTVTVFDQSGRKIQTSVSNYDGYSPITMNVPTLSGGFYLLSVQNSHCTSTRRFVIVK